MNVIYKYELGPVTKLDLPLGAKVLTVQMQRDRLVLWALINQRETLKEARYFNAINTGVPFDLLSPRYIGTATSSNGIVWHVFERG